MAQILYRHAYRNAHIDWKIHLKNSDFTIIIAIMRVKNTVENVNRLFLKIADQSYLVKIVLIERNKCSQADIAHNSVNRSHPEQRTRTNQRIQTNGWPAVYIRVAIWLMQRENERLFLTSVLTHCTIYSLLFYTVIIKP